VHFRRTDSVGLYVVFARTRPRRAGLLLCSFCRFHRAANSGFWENSQ
jgi:hypothetical protein